MYDVFSLEITDFQDIKNLHSLRDKNNTYDISLLQDKGLKIDLENITDIPQGRFVIEYKVQEEVVPFECLFHYKTSDKLYVVFNGSLTTEYPEFKRWSWYNVFNGSMLNIADPMLKNYKNLELGWYYGDKEHNYRQYLVEIIKKISKFYNISNNNIIMYASSGGGSVALDCAAEIKGSTAIVINPQINLYNYKRQSINFQKITGIDLQQNDERNDILYKILENKQSYYLFVENISSKDDFIQIEPLFKKLNMPIKYGITRHENIGIWCYDIMGANPHNIQENRILYEFIDFLANSLQTQENWSCYEKQFLWLSELWRDSYLRQENISRAEQVLDITENHFMFEKSFKEIEILPKTDKFNAYLFDLKLRKLTKYKIIIANSKLLQGSSSGFCLSVKNKILNKPLIFRKFKYGELCEFKFLVRSRADELELKLYPSDIGKSEEVSAIFENITIYYSC